MQMYDNGFVVLYRSLLNWEWYQDRNTTLLFIHLLLTANYAPKEWHGRTIEVGQRVTSLSKLSQEISFSIKEIRTCLKHLQATGEVACESTSQYTVITIKNYEKYQRGASATANSVANKKAIKGQSRGKGRANKGQQLNKDNKDNKNKEKNIKKESGGIAGSPIEGDRLPAIGEGACLIEIDGENHRFPESWYGLAEKKGMSIRDYVMWRHQ